ncbi:MAG: PfkB family carbohydrate kinase, partial [Pseudomonadota bacterium]
MTIFCFGSINIDHIYLVPRFPLAGETLADTGYRTGLGGKGCNQSLAAAAAGATVKMVGAVGDDGAWAIDHLADAGIDVGRISLVPEATGHAVINVTPEGENQIVIHGGANRAVSEGMIKDTLRDAIAEQWWLCQEETSLVPWSAKMAKDAGLKIAYSAAPFVPEAALEMLPLSDVVAVNAGEAAALAAACGTDIESIPVPML